MYYYRQPAAENLRDAVRVWMARNPDWHLREVPASEPATPWMLSVPLTRRAAPEEIASEIVNNPELRQALTLLASPPGQEIEQATAELWLSGWQAELLSDGLTQAWKIVLDQNRPVWQRADVLAGAILFLGLVGLFIWSGRTA
jgi:hypothetical protein